MRRTLTVLSLAISAVTAGLFSTSVLADDQVINLYSARHYPTDEALYSDFTKATGIKINRVDSDDAGIIARLKAEGTVSPADVILLVDAALGGEWEAFRNALSHLILPASLLGYFSLAYISRMTRSFMLNELSQEYVVAARAKGLSETRIIWRHALRNAMVPLVTVIALSYAGLLEGSVLTETVFAWPGLGLYLTNSLQNADMNAVLGATIVVGSVFIGLNLVSDLLYQLLDPRTRAR